MVVIRLWKWCCSHTGYFGVTYPAAAPLHVPGHRHTLRFDPQYFVRFSGFYDVNHCTRTTFLTTPLLAIRVGGLAQHSVLRVGNTPCTRLAPTVQPGSGICAPLLQYRVGTPASPASHLAQPLLQYMVGTPWSRVSPSVRHGMDYAAGATLSFAAPAHYHCSSRIAQLVT